ncbi:hypothetical protein [Saccharothrix texasensis]|uniref:hypothetical protein n=1 Tax=Saccharothrix texasensis TaxID=103734 RepID=UPI0011CE8DB1|nr:hypothetical protein [Saccharothrix texasensis]
MQQLLRIASIVGAAWAAGLLLGAANASATVSNSCAEPEVETVCGSVLGTDDFTTDWAGRINAMDAV